MNSKKLPGIALLVCGSICMSLVPTMTAAASSPTLNHYSDYGVVEQNQSVASSGVNINNDPFGYSDAYTDSESGLQYLQVRYYDPTMMRFTQMDTYPLLNRYAYANENPIMDDDPSGHNAVGASQNSLSRGDAANYNTQIFLIVGFGIASVVGILTIGVSALAEAGEAEVLSDVLSDTTANKVGNQNPIGGISGKRRGLFSFVDGDSYYEDSSDGEDDECLAEAVKKMELLESNKNVSSGPSSSSSDISKIDNFRTVSSSDISKIDNFRTVRPLGYSTNSVESSSDSYRFASSISSASERSFTSLESPEISEFSDDSKDDAIEIRKPKISGNVHVNDDWDSIERMPGEEGNWVGSVERSSNLMSKSSQSFSASVKRVSTGFSATIINAFSS